MPPLRVLYNNIFYKTHPADDDRVTQHHRGLRQSRRSGRVCRAEGQTTPVGEGRRRSK